MQNIGVIFGGKSTEHDVSILTGLHLAKHVTEDYHVILIYLTRDNQLVFGSSNIDDYIHGKIKKARPFHAWHKISCVVNCCHGGAGEDGSLAAMLRVYNIPITSCNPYAAWQQQSKIITRQMLSTAGFAQPRWQMMTDTDLQKIQIPLPLVVKPEMQGSSIGVTVARTNDELQTALETALSLGPRAIVEEYLADMREVNVAVMRQNGQIITSGLEVVGGKNFFSFAEKYFNTESGFVKKNGQTPDQEFLATVTDKIKALAVKAYELFDSSGVVRSDFMVQGDRIILNENNTVPGFMAYHLWLREHVPYGVVIETMIKEAIAQNQKLSHYRTDYQSDILAKNRQLVVEI